MHNARTAECDAITGARLNCTAIDVDDLALVNMFAVNFAHEEEYRKVCCVINVGNRITSVGTFQKWLYLSGIGRTITLGISRDGKTIEKRVRVEERPEAAVPR